MPPGGRHEDFLRSYCFQIQRDTAVHVLRQPKACYPLKHCFTSFPTNQSFVFGMNDGTSPRRYLGDEAPSLGANRGITTPLDAPLGYVKICSGALPRAWIHDVRGEGGPLLFLSEAGTAFGDAYIDDGSGNLPGPNRSLDLANKQWYARDY
ncbi:hypothetical protein F5I97DRAFT_1850882, partial [Phlebopus sp. FC_14]